MDDAPANTSGGTAYIDGCKRCGDGLLRFWKNSAGIVALCDECELVWDDVKKIHADSETKAVTSFPAEESEQAKWGEASDREIKDAGLEECIGGYSE